MTCRSASMLSCRHSCSHACTRASQTECWQPIHLAFWLASVQALHQAVRHAHHHDGQQARLMAGLPACCHAGFHGEIFPKQSLGETSATKMGLSGIRVSTLTGWVSQSFNCAEIAVYGCSHRVLSGAGTQHDGQRQHREADSRNHRVREALRECPPSRQAMRPFRQAIWL